MRQIVVFIILKAVLCGAQYYFRENFTRAPSTTPLPFPPCRADDIDCLRRGIRSFFFIMDAGLYGMKPVDPTWVNSVAVAMPEDGVRFLIRNANVTGARWTRLADRNYHQFVKPKVEKNWQETPPVAFFPKIYIMTNTKLFNLEGGKSGVLFTTDLHITGEITMETTARIDPYYAFITIDVQDVESNVTYSWSGQKGLDNEDYILIGSPRIAVRNMRTPTFFIQGTIPIIDISEHLKNPWTLE